METKVSFAQKVYEVCSSIPEGKVSTYGDVARKIGSSPRAVGQALRCNPYAPKVPCHRVVSALGRIGGFMGETKGVEIERKVALLKDEGVNVSDGKILDFEKVRFCWE